MEKMPNFPEEDELSDLNNQELQDFVKKLTAVANEAKENLKSVKGEVQSLESDIHKSTADREKLLPLVAQTIGLREALCELEKTRAQQQTVSRELERGSTQCSSEEASQQRVLVLEEEMQRELALLQEREASLAKNKENIDRLTTKTKRELTEAQTQSRAVETELLQLKRAASETGSCQSVQEKEDQLLDEFVVRRGILQELRQAASKPLGVGSNISQARP
ncbi:hypothetical protein HHUSO_G12838 [Huso huso]|uniref:Uncharacterized protein n=1 Tax=Huso huso TaxID=61971 RepID=A0ABR0ZJF8_HUSHU